MSLRADLPPYEPERSCNNFQLTKQNWNALRRGWEIANQSVAKRGSPLITKLQLAPGKGSIEVFVERIETKKLRSHDEDVIDDECRDEANFNESISFVERVRSKGEDKLIRDRCGPA